MANVWEKFDKQFDTKALKDDIKEAAENGTTFVDVPLGTYEVAIEKMELVESKSSSQPMVSMWFKILVGEFKNSRIFMNQVINKGFQIHIVNEFLRSLQSGLVVEFETYGQYAQLLMDIHECIDQNMEYALKYGETNKGFKTFEITDVFVVE